LLDFVGHGNYLMCLLNGLKYRTVVT
jgi:hypothetical protein